jgi:uncharacterized protein YgbK (DUF1537 family)
MIVVIADDLSGASELANGARQCGLTAELQQAFDPSATCDVCAVNTESRSLPRDEAILRVADVARQISAAQPRWIFKKVDSMLRGHVGAEIEMMLQVIGDNRAILVPANPSRGRVIRSGQYLIDACPLNETPLAADPEFPRRTADVEQLVATTSLPIQTATRSPRSHGPLLFVPDVHSSHDVAYQAERADDFAVVAGAVDFFLALLARRCRVAVDPPKPCLIPPREAGCELLVCGSKAAWNDRVARCESRGIPWYCLPSDCATSESEEIRRRWVDHIADSLPVSKRALVGVGTQVIYDDAHRMIAQHHLAKAAREIGERSGVRRWFLEGGATASAVLGAMKCHRFPLGDPMPHGCAELLSADDSTLRWYVKPGSYVWPEQLWPGHD